MSAPLMHCVGGELVVGVDGPLSLVIFGAVLILMAFTVLLPVIISAYLIYRVAAEKDRNDRPIVSAWVVTIFSLLLYTEIIMCIMRNNG